MFICTQIAPRKLSIFLMSCCIGILWYWPLGMHNPLSLILLVTKLYSFIRLLSLPLPSKLSQKKWKFTWLRTVLLAALPCMKSFRKFMIITAKCQQKIKGIKASSTYFLQELLPSCQWLKKHKVCIWWSLDKMKRRPSSTQRKKTQGKKFILLLMIWLAFCKQKFSSWAAIMRNVSGCLDHTWMKSFPVIGHSRKII